MNVLVATTQTPYISGGAEVQAAALVGALRTRGHRAELLRLPFFTNPPELAIQSMQVARMLEIGETACGPIDRVIALKFPAYLIEHSGKVLWLIHQYRQLYDLWEEPGVGLAHLPAGHVLREAVLSADIEYLHSFSKRFAISRLVADRLLASCKVQAELLYPPLPDSTRYSCQPADNYFLFPARISPLKRQHLVVEALARTRFPVRIVFIGVPDDPTAADSLSDRVAALGLGDRVRYLAWVDEGMKRDLFSRAIGVVFPPRLEDLGLVVQEAMWSGKPVVTCHDSGGVLEFVTDGENGLVSEPEPDALAASLDALWCDRGRAADLGRAGWERITSLGLSWDGVVERLLA